MFINDIFKKKLNETVLNPRDPQGDYDAKRKVIHDLSLDPGVDQQAVQQRRLDLDKEAKAKGLKEQDVKEGGPFSYGAKKPRKGSVADLAAQKRKEQEKGKQPIEPKDQRVGVAKIVKEFAPSGGGGGRWYSDDQLYDIIGEDWLEAFDVSGDQGNIDLRGERARLFLAQEAEAWLTDRGYRVNVLDVRDDGDELSWYIQGPLYRGLSEGGFDIPEIPRAPQPRPQPKEKTSEDASKYMDTKPSSVTAKQADELGAMARKAFRPDLNPDYYKDDEPVRPRRNWDYSDPDVQPIVKQWMDKNLIDRKPMTYQQGVDEGSAQDKLHRRHQELRKKSGLPDPDYYKELKASYDLPDEERYAKQKEIKQKYKVTNEDRERYLEELGRAGYEIINERRMTCPECGGAAYSNRLLAEKQDACYHKVKSRYKVWPSAYASGALVRCRKKGAKNWGNKSKK